MPIDAEYPGEVNLTCLLTKEIKDSTGKTNFRLLLRDAMKDLDQFTLFVNPVIQDYPELKDQYLSVIEFPRCLTDIKNKLNAKNTACYTYVGDCLSDLCLIPTNAIRFNAGNDLLLEELSKFSQAVMRSVHEVFQRYNSVALVNDQVAQFSAPEQMFRVIHGLFPPGKVPPCLIRKNKSRSPYYEEVQELMEIIKGLSASALSGCVAALSLELGNCVDEDGKVVVEFSAMRPHVFWWFDALVRETYESERKNAPK